MLIHCHCHCLHCFNCLPLFLSASPTPFLPLFLYVCLFASSNSHSPSPPSSSLAYSLLSASSEQDPSSTSGCSSEQSARVQTQKELMRALKELKIRLPAERKTKGRSSTLNALKYALSCVKQVQGRPPLCVNVCGILSFSCF